MIQQVKKPKIAERLVAIIKYCFVKKNKMSYKFYNKQAFIN